MYEFSNKEIREKFKKTEYGKKTNKMLYTALGFFGASCLIEIILFDLWKINILNSEFGLVLCEFVIFVSFVMTLYFDGKRDGAIEQFKRMKKK